MRSLHGNSLLVPLFQDIGFRVKGLGILWDYTGDGIYITAT